MNGTSNQDQTVNLTEWQLYSALNAATWGATYGGSVGRATGYGQERSEHNEKVAAGYYDSNPPYYKLTIAAHISEKMVYIGKEHRKNKDGSLEYIPGVCSEVY